MKDIYEYLGSYGLIKPGKAHQRLAKFSKQKMSKFLDEYLSVAKNRHFVLPAETGATDIYPDSFERQITLDIIQRLSIYANRIYVHDPLIQLVSEWQNLDFDRALTLKFPSRDERVQNYLVRLASEIENLTQIRPLVDAGIVHLSPSELLQYSKNPQTLYLENIYSSQGTMAEALMPEKKRPELPPLLLDYCNHNLVTYPASFVNNEPVIHDSQDMLPRDMIAIKFKGDTIPKFFNMANFEVFDDPVSGQKRWVSYFNLHERTSMDPSKFQHWERGSRFEVISERMDRLFKDLYLANRAGSKFITNLPASRDLAKLNLDFEIDKKRSNIVTLDDQVFDDKFLPEP